MKTIILPGYSLHNRDWALKMESFLMPQIICTIHGWGHWTGGSFSLPREINGILEEIRGEKVNIIAKSVGTRVTMHLIPKILNELNKVILCGIPTKFESEAVRTLYRDGLLKLGANNVIIFQNTGDPFCPYVTVKAFIASVDENIEVIEKPRNDHEYPYFADFKTFLSSK